MAELADAADSKSADLRVMGVRPPLPAPHIRIMNVQLIRCIFSLCPNCARDVLFYPFCPIQQDIKTATYVRSMDGRRPAPPGIHKTSDLRCFKSATNAMLMPDRGIAVVLLGSIGYLHFRRLCRPAPSGISWSHLCKLRSICSNNLTSLRTIRKADQKPDPEGALAVFPDCGHCHAIQSSMRQRPQEIKKLN